MSLVKRPKLLTDYVFEYEGDDRNRRLKVKHRYN